MRTDKPPEELKAERVQGQSVVVVTSIFAKVIAALEWIETTARGLLSVFRSDSESS